MHSKEFIQVSFSVFCEICGSFSLFLTRVSRVRKLLFSCTWGKHLGKVFNDSGILATGATPQFRAQAGTNGSSCILAQKTQLETKLLRDSRPIDYRSCFLPSTAKSQNTFAQHMSLYDLVLSTFHSIIASHVKKTKLATNQFF